MKGLIKENHFEVRIRDIINTDIISVSNNFIMLNNQKGNDILICRNGENPALFFIEVKYYNKSHGRLGIGHGNGAGFQPEILQKKVNYFEKNTRWILGNIDDEFYYIATNDEIRNYLSGGIIDYKQNNIQTKIFSEVKKLKRNELVNELLIFFNKL